MTVSPLRAGGLAMWEYRLVFATTDHLPPITDISSSAMSFFLYFIIGGGGTSIIYKDSGASVEARLNFF